MKKMIFLFSVIASLVGCNRPEPNYEGVLMTEYGRNGINSFKIVTGAQGMLGPGSELYQVPMWEQAGDPDVVEITAKDAGVFTVDPSYTYTPIRGKGAEIVFNYKNYRIQNPETFFELSVQKRLKEEFKTKFFDLTTLTSGLKPPASMLKAVEDRNKAIQEANRVKNELETSRMLLEKAKIDAETNKVQSVGLTKEILMQQYIEMLGKTSNKVIITDGRTPVILGN